MLLLCQPAAYEFAKLRALPEYHVVSRIECNDEAPFREWQIGCKVTCKSQHSIASTPLRMIIVHIVLHYYGAQVFGAEMLQRAPGDTRVACTKLADSRIEALASGMNDKHCW